MSTKPLALLLTIGTRDLGILKDDYEALSPLQQNVLQRFFDMDPVFICQGKSYYYLKKKGTGEHTFKSLTSTFFSYLNQPEHSWILPLLKLPLLDIFFHYAHQHHFSYHEVILVATDQENASYGKDDTRWVAEIITMLLMHSSPSFSCSLELITHDPVGAFSTSTSFFYRLLKRKTALYTLHLVTSGGIPQIRESIYLQYLLFLSSFEIFNISDKTGTVVSITSSFQEYARYILFKNDLQALLAQYHYDSIVELFNEKLGTALQHHSSYASLFHLLSIGKGKLAFDKKVVCDHFSHLKKSLKEKAKGVSYWLPHSLFLSADPLEQQYCTNLLELFDNLIIFYEKKAWVDFVARLITFYDLCLSFFFYHSYIELVKQRFGSSDSHRLRVEHFYYKSFLKFEDVKVRHKELISQMITDFCALYGFPFPTQSSLRSMMDGPLEKTHSLYTFYELLSLAKLAPYQPFLEMVKSTEEGTSADKTLKSLRNKSVLGHGCSPVSSDEVRRVLKDPEHFCSNLSAALTTALSLPSLPFNTYHLLNGLITTVLDQVEEHLFNDLVRVAP
ncbi:MAG: hypothetical protein QW594_02355 [Candidatus Woesearchaeota archaeon]